MAKRWLWLVGPSRGSGPPRLQGGDTALASQKLPAITLIRLQRAVPGGGEPADVVISAPRSESGAVITEIARLRRTAVADGLAHEPVNIRANAARTAALVELPLTGEGDNTASRDAVRDLRDRLVPTTLGRIPGAKTEVTGKSAARSASTGRCYLTRSH